MKKVIVICGVFILIAIVFKLFIASKNTCKNCNVILISIDTLRRNNLGVYGYKRNTSPNLDEFAKNALVFDNFYSTSSWTLPAHSSIMAGDYPHKLRMQVTSDKLSDKYITIAEVLKHNDYYTVGWDAGTFVSKRWNFTQGFDEYKTFKGGVNIDDAEPIFTNATNWLSQNKNKKFFLFLHTFQVHDPFCPEERFDKFKGNYKGNLNCVGIDTISKQNRGGISLGKDDLERFVSLYDAEILQTDYYINLLLQKLKDLELEKKKILLIN
jgi:arylsulfatase A-like enzyme